MWNKFVNSYEFKKAAEGFWYVAAAVAIVLLAQIATLIGIIEDGNISELKTWGFAALGAVGRVAAVAALKFITTILLKFTGGGGANP